MAASSRAVFFVFAILPTPRYHTQRDTVQPLGVMLVPGAAVHRLVGIVRLDAPARRVEIACTGAEGLQRVADSARRHSPRPAPTRPVRPGSPEAAPPDRRPRIPVVPVTVVVGRCSHRGIYFTGPFTDLYRRGLQGLPYEGSFGKATGEVKARRPKGLDRALPKLYSKPRVPGPASRLRHSARRCHALLSFLAPTRLRKAPKMKADQSEPSRRLTAARMPM
jgi:hypothetical protein